MEKGSGVIAVIDIPGSPCHLFKRIVLAHCERKTLCFVFVFFSFPPALRNSHSSAAEQEGAHSQQGTVIQRKPLTGSQPNSFQPPRLLAYSRYSRCSLVLFRTDCLLVWALPNKPFPTPCIVRNDKARQRLLQISSNINCAKQTPNMS